MLPDEELITVFVEVEGLLNSRPLNKVEDDVPLSPNLFYFLWTNSRAICTRECLYYEVQPTKEVTQGLRVDLSSVVKMAKFVLTYAEYSL